MFYVLKLNIRIFEASPIVVVPEFNSYCNKNNNNNKL